MSEHDDPRGGDALSPDTETLLGAYVLDAVDDVDRRRVERLLATDPAARAEVERLNAAADELAEAAAAGASAPPELFGSLMARVAERAETGAGRTGPSAPEALPLAAPSDTAAAPSGITANDADTAPAVASFDEHVRTRAARRSRAPWILTAAAAVLLFVVGGFALANRDGSDTPVDSVAAMEQLARDAAALPGARTGELTDASGTMSVQVVVDPAGHAFVMSGVLPTLPDGSTYQLWGVDGGTPVSLGLLGTDPVMSVVGVDAQVHTLAITAEPAGGSAGPTSTPMMSGTITEA